MLTDFNNVYDSIAVCTVLDNPAFYPGSRQP